MDVMKLVTDRIISQLEKGVIPWKQPWFGKEGCISGVTGKPYSYINQCLLGRPGEWLTFKQITDLGGKVKKGEKASPVVFWKLYEKEVKGKVDENGDPIMENIPVLKYYNVFNIDQTEGIESKFNPSFEHDMSDVDDIEEFVYDYLDRENIVFDKQRGNNPFYYKDIDAISCPDESQFKTSEEFFSEVFHLLVSSTSNEKRLNRDTNGSKEKLISEIGAATMCSRLGMETDETMMNSAAYISEWIDALEDDKFLIVSAAGKAEKAVDYIFGKTA